MASKNALNSSGGSDAHKFSRINLISAPGKTPSAMTDDAMTDKLRPSLLPLTGCGSPLRCSPLFLLLTPLRRRRLVGGGCSVRRSVSTLTMFRRLAVASGLSVGTGAKPARSQGAAASANMATAPGRRAIFSSRSAGDGRARPHCSLGDGTRRDLARTESIRKYFMSYERCIATAGGATCQLVYALPRSCRGEYI